MVIIFQDGFETLPFTGLVKIPPWTATSIVGVGSALIVENVNPHHGTYNAKATISAAPGAAAWCSKVFVADDPAFGRFYVKFNTLGVGADNMRLEIFKLDANDWQYSSAVEIYRAGGVLYWGIATFEAGGFSEQHSAVTPVTGQWYCVELKRDVANNLQELWIDLVSVQVRNIAITQNTARVRAGYTYLETATLNIMFMDCVDVQDQRVFCEVPFGGGCNPSQMAKVILGL